MPASGQLLQISKFGALFQVLGTRYGGDGKTTFGIPDLRSTAPNGLTYAICTAGVTAVP
jgi:microcystin-dependent protein